MVSTSTLILSIFLLLLSLWGVLWLLFCILQPLFQLLGFKPSFSFLQSGLQSGGNFSQARSKSDTPSSKNLSSREATGAWKGFGERWAFRRSVRALKDLDRAIQQENFKQASTLFLRALHLEFIKHSAELIAKSSHHHMDLLNKLIVHAELQGSSVRNLPSLESLFSQRTELLKEALEAQLAKDRFKKKQLGKGKNPPSWSTKEYDSRLREVSQALREVHASLRKEMRAAVDSITTPKKTAESKTHYH